MKTQLRFSALSRGALALALTLSLSSGLAPSPWSRTARAAGATPTLLTADEVARRARATSFDVQARGDERAAAEDAVSGAKAGFLPRLSGTVRYTRLSSLTPPTLGNLVVAPANAVAGQAPDPTTLRVFPVTFPMISDQYLGQATLQVPLSDYLLRLPQAHAAATANARAAALTEEAARLRVATDARVIYYGWVRARLATGIARQGWEQARAHLVDVQKAADAGSASRADILRVESQVASAELLLARAHNLAAITEQQVRTAMHDDSHQAYEIGEDVEQPVAGAVAGGQPPAVIAAGADVAAIDATTLDGLRAEAAAHRLEPRALTEGAGAARQQAAAALSAGLPRLDAVGNATYANPNPRVFPQEAVYRGTWDASIQISWAITDLPAATAARRGARARASTLEAERGALLDAIGLEVTQAAEAQSEARTAIATAQRGVGSAAESYRVRRVLFQNGRATSVELTDAETELTRARLDLVNAQIDLRLAGARLTHALGRDAGAGAGPGR